MRVGFGREPKVRDRIAAERVGPALQQDQLGFRGLEIALGFLPGLEEHRVVGARRQRNVQLRSLRGAAPGFAAAARAGIQKAPVFVQVDELELGIGLERVEHAVAVMRVDVDVGDTADAVDLPRGFDRDSAIVEDAEPRCTGRALHDATRRSE